MQLRQFTTGIAALAAIASVLSANSAQAFSFKVTDGVANPWTGATNQGAYSEFSTLAGTTTVDFNSGQVPTTGFAKYSFSNGNSNSSVRSDMWAPVGAEGEKNTSNYLEVFQGNNVIINLAKSLNYFGINWGAAHTGNTYSFYNGNTLVKSFTTKDIDQAGGFATYSALHPGSNEDGAQRQQNGSYYQGNGYVHFYADSAADIFNKIVISQAGGGGFETDNHSFHEGTGKFDFDTESVPEPGLVMGLVGVGGFFLRQRRRVKSA
ncbi:MAG: PEP-CTERM sorting domain-containing protein [Oscillatoriophycideae cyanobacterium NC_groundwater_1537_Pr4_S-0.65um_50_18]|nr:PEP-CTERM sorting domain-containing protein [Oscillatoriophycideae cyanobacterium NC_groundwater_1537_Pr4_S-0.65um_50_18]